ncbi:MAG: SH3 domain-containing protein [Candidatus Dormibacteria bacterium]
MATDEKQRILDWCSADSGVRCVGEEGDPGAEFTLVLEAAGSELTATLPIGADRLVLRNRVDLAQAAQPVPGDLADQLADLEDRRPGPVTADLDAGSELVEVASWVVLDGLTKHSFLTAVSDVVRTRRAVRRLAGLPADEPAASPALADLAGVAAPGPDQSGETPEQAALAVSGMPAGTSSSATADAPAAGTSAPAPWEWPPVSEHPTFPAAEPATEPQPEEPASDAFAFRAEERTPAPAPWSSPEATVFEPVATPAQAVPEPALGFEVAPGPEPGFAQQPAPMPSPAPAQPWTPSHRVPPQGMQAWAAPDPTGAVVATLGGHLPVQVTEVRGAWAHILCSNGWTGWVDDRLLVVGA